VHPICTVTTENNSTCAYAQTSNSLSASTGTFANSLVCAKTIATRLAELPVPPFIKHESTYKTRFAVRYRREMGDVQWELALDPIPVPNSPSQPTRLSYSSSHLLLEQLSRLIILTGGSCINNGRDPGCWSRVSNNRTDAAKTICRAKAAINQSVSACAEVARGINSAHKSKNLADSKTKPELLAALTSCNSK
jgi:hypothetical protein